MSIGMDMETGRVMTGIDHIIQSITTIFSTALGERVMREWVGNPGLKLLGENLTEVTILRWFTTAYTVLSIFEPRVRVIKFDIFSATTDGEAGFFMDVEFQPYAHQAWQQARLYVALEDGAVVIRPGA